MKRINRFPEGHSRTSCTHEGIHASRHSNIPVHQIAEQRLQEKNRLRRFQSGRQVQDTGRGPENGGKNAENFEAKEKRGVTNFPKME
jgi:hypothetical protein